VTQRLQWAVDACADHTVLELVGDLDIGTISDLQKALAAVSGHRLVVVDLDGVPFCGARGMRMLLDAADGMAAHGGTLVLSRVPALVTRLLAVLRAGQRPHPVPDDRWAVAVTWAGSDVRQ
jgi:anti-anti-sigma factor